LLKNTASKEWFKRDQDVSKAGEKEGAYLRKGKKKEEGLLGQEKGEQRRG